MLILLSRSFGLYVVKRNAGILAIVTANKYTKYHLLWLRSMAELYSDLLQRHLRRAYRQLAEGAKGVGWIKKTQQAVLLLIAFYLCRGEKTRTSDPLHPMQVR